MTENNRQWGKWKHRAQWEYLGRAPDPDQELPRLLEKGPWKSKRTRSSQYRQRGVSEAEALRQESMQRILEGRDGQLTRVCESVV